MHLRATPILLWLALCGCTQTATYSGDAHRAPIAYDWPATCPEGHTELRQVPIVYGLLLPTPKIGRRADAPFIAGGCVYLSRFSPDALAICPECEYEFNPVQQKWQRYTRDLKTFRTPLSPLVTSFPLPPVPQDRPPHYARTVVGELTQRELVGYWTNEAEHDVQRRVEEYFALLGAAAEPTAGTDYFGPLTTYVSQTPCGRIAVNVSAPQDGRVNVTMTFEPKW